MGGLIKRSFSLAGHRTSIALEPEFWEVLRAEARSRGVAMSGLVASVDAERDGTTPLASALRLLALRQALAGIVDLGAATAVSHPAPAVRESSLDITRR